MKIEQDTTAQSIHHSQNSRGKPFSRCAAESTPFDSKIRDLLESHQHLRALYDLAEYHYRHPEVKGFLERMGFTYGSKPFESNDRSLFQLKGWFLIRLMLLRLAGYILDHYMENIKIGARKGN